MLFHNSKEIYLEMNIEKAKWVSAARIIIGEINNKYL